MRPSRDAEHYAGLIAELYDDWFIDDGPDDEAFFERAIRSSGGRALYVACGTGRLLLPYRRAGLDVEGLDASPEMLDILRRKAERAGLEVTLHEQRMQALDLPQRYATIIVPYGSFQILIEDEDIDATLTGFARHLAPGGTLWIALFFPRKEFDTLQRWRVRRVASRDDGTTVVMSEAVDYDTTDRIQTDWYRYDFIEGDVVVHSIMRSMRQRWFTKPEFVLRLEQAGFVDIDALGDYEDEPFADAHTNAVFRATWPG